MPPTNDPNNLMGKLSRGWNLGVQSSVNGLLSVNALLNGARTRPQSPLAPPSLLRPVEMTWTITS